MPVDPPTWFTGPDAVSLGLFLPVLLRDEVDLSLDGTGTLGKRRCPAHYVGRMAQAVDVQGRGVSQQPDSRVLVLSQRRLHTAKHLTMIYEFEDAVRDLDDVQTLAPGPAPYADVGALARRAVNGGLARVGGPRRSPPWTMPSMRPTSVVGHHDLFFAVFTDAYELSYLRRLKGWRERCRRAVCFLTEVWSPGVESNADYYDVLREFDAVYLFTPEAGPALASLGAPAPSFLPVGVDAKLFSPVPVLPSRVVDVYAYGRTSPVLHQQLLDLVETAGTTYVYDTTFQAKVPIHGEHRALLANMLKRSRYSLAHRINDSAQRRLRTGGEESLSSRYFEASAGGAVLLGSRPHTADFDACFDWPDAVIDLPYESFELEEVLHDLAGQPDRLARARAHGVRAALLRHDWVYRWERVLEDSGLPVSTGMLQRKAQLQELADAVTAEGVSAAPDGA